GLDQARLWRCRRRQGRASWRVFGTLGQADDHPHGHGSRLCAAGGGPNHARPADLSRYSRTRPADVVPLFRYSQGSLYFLGACGGRRGFAVGTQLRGEQSMTRQTIRRWVYAAAALTLAACSQQAPSADQQQQADAQNSGATATAAVGSNCSAQTSHDWSAP